MSDLPFLPLAQIKILIRENLYEAFPNKANEWFALRIEGPRVLNSRLEPILGGNTQLNLAFDSSASISKN